MCIPTRSASDITAIKIKSLLARAVQFGNFVSATFRVGLIQAYRNTEVTDFPILFAFGISASAINCMGNAAFQSLAESRRQVPISLPSLPRVSARAPRGACGGAADMGDEGSVKTRFRVCMVRYSMALINANQVWCTKEVPRLSLIGSECLFVIALRGSCSAAHGQTRVLSQEPRCDAGLCAWCGVPRSWGSAGSGPCCESPSSRSHHSTNGWGKLVELRTDRAR